MASDSAKQNIRVSHGFIYLLLTAMITAFGLTICFIIRTDDATIFSEIINPLNYQSTASKIKLKHTFNANSHEIIEVFDNSPIPNQINEETQQPLSSESSLITKYSKLFASSHKAHFLNMEGLFIWDNVCIENWKEEMDRYRIHRKYYDKILFHFFCRNPIIPRIWQY